MGRIQSNKPDAHADHGRILRRDAILRAGAALAACLFLANCNAAISGKFSRSVDPKYGVASSPRVVEDGDPIPKGGGYYRVGKPYTVGGREYVPEANPDYRAEGIASWYGDQFHGRLTANGEVFDKESISAAHTTMPIPSYARVTNLANRRSVIVRVNDRGPFHSDRIIDLSARSADMLGFRKNGVARVRVEYVGPANLKGSDDIRLAATLRTNGSPAPAPSHVMVAAGGPFVPDAREPVPQRRMAQMANVPEPPERPFNLGRYPASTPAVYEPQENRPPVVMASMNGSGNQRRIAPAAVLQGAPVHGSAMMTGRGLY